MATENSIQPGATGMVPQSSHALNAATPAVLTLFRQYLGKLDIKGSAVDTKVFPSFAPGHGHSPDLVRSAVDTSIKFLQPVLSGKLRILYLHAPDRTVPFVDTLRAVNDLYKEGKFEQFGLSNYPSYEVAEILGICEQHGFVKPTVYQGSYSVMTRSIETELVPCLRKFGLRFVIYSPLGGGFMSGRFSKDTEPSEGRFGGDGILAKLYRSHYFKDGYFEALDEIKAIAASSSWFPFAKYNITTTEIALRWLQHHSVLTPSDGVIIGASSVAQAEQNCADSEKGPLPEEVLAVLDAAWLKVAAISPHYAM
ncbi:Aldo/keto reductase [Exidia glandulosa HHB12029]|uniref:Aldo/keto reductase n=1 Tax=Exidia glandulosa HHB12029 TaxID=1314781 RepID=A0A165GVC9_EXIGL|nr:Aldo/keto reductase [Exidia glandulosa HHB12029]